MDIPKKRSCNHEENRCKVCGPCGRKICLGTKNIVFYEISESCEKLIQSFISDKFSLAEPKYHKSICTTCRITITEHERQVFRRPLPKMPQYEIMQLPIKTRQ